MISLQPLFISIKQTCGRGGGGGGGSKARVACRFALRTPTTHFSPSHGPIRHRPKFARLLPRRILLYTRAVKVHPNHTPSFFLPVYPVVANWDSPLYSFGIPPHGRSLLKYFSESFLPFSETCELAQFELLNDAFKNRELFPCSGGESFR